jgi:hypothetical protein
MEGEQATDMMGEENAQYRDGGGAGNYDGGGKCAVQGWWGSRKPLLNPFTLVVSP